MPNLGLSGRHFYRAAHNQQLGLVYKTEEITTMKILLTGAAGFVGRAAVDILSQDHEVTAFDIRPTTTTPFKGMYWTMQRLKP